MTNEVEERQLSVKKVRTYVSCNVFTQSVDARSVCPRRDDLPVCVIMYLCVTHSGAHMRYLCTCILCV